MLVLSRRVGESIVIGDEVTVTVLEVRGDVVRVGIRAPRSVTVHREELLREVEETNRASASPTEETVASLAQRLTPSAARGSAGPRPGPPGRPAG
jgi:carbon storage regulator